MLILSITIGISVITYIAYKELKKFLMELVNDWKA